MKIRTLKCSPRRRLTYQISPNIPVSFLLLKLGEHYLFRFFVKLNLVKEPSHLFMFKKKQVYKCLFHSVQREKGIFFIVKVGQKDNTCFVFGQYPSCFTNKSIKIKAIQKCVLKLFDHSGPCIYSSFRGTFKFAKYLVLVLV